jgi:hypothetical protein
MNDQDLTQAADATWNDSVPERHPVIDEDFAEQILRALTDDSDD